MTTSTLTLTEFLLARLDEDERHARKLAETDQRPVLSLATTINHPQRLLAEVAAKHAIAEEHRLRIDVEEVDSCGTCGGFTSRTSKVAGIVHSGYLIPWPCPTLRHLAAVYADHPDYRDEWRVG